MGKIKFARCIFNIFKYDLTTRKLKNFHAFLKTYFLNLIDVIATVLSLKFNTGYFLFSILGLKISYFLFMSPCKNLSRFLYFY